MPDFIHSNQGYFTGIGTILSLGLSLLPPAFKAILKNMGKSVMREQMKHIKTIKASLFAEFMSTLFIATMHNLS